MAFVMAEPILETPRLVAPRDDVGRSGLPRHAAADERVMQHYPKCCSRDEAKLWLGRMIERYAKHGHALLAGIAADDAANRSGKWACCGNTSMASTSRRSAT